VRSGRPFDFQAGADAARFPPPSTLAGELMRTALRSHYRDAQDAHPGLLIQRGYERDDRETEAGRQAKTAHLRRICDIPPGSFYTNAYQRWQAATANDLRFTQVQLALQPQTRLFIGLSGGGMLETGCAVSHSYGMPYIPGSSLKGVVRAHVRQSPFAEQHAAVVDELFGAAADAERGHAEGLAGLVVFHDAWWVPGSAETAFAEEIVTSHHLDYYGSEGAVDASDCDSPVPNAQIAVRGGFLFVLEGAPAWRELAAKMLLAALSKRGIGAKTRSGYGLFDPEPKVPAAAICEWVDDTIAALVPKPHNTKQEALLGRRLAERWAALEGDLKAAALADIRGRWQALEQWDTPAGKGARAAKKIYTGEA